MPQSKGCITPNRTKPCPLTRRQLGKLFYEGKSLADISRKCEVHTTTVVRWFDRFNVDRTIRYVDMDNEMDATMDKNGKVVWIADTNTLEAEHSLVTQSSLPTAPLEDEAVLDDEEAGAWRLMTQAQRKAIVILGGSQIDELNCTDVEIAQRIGILPETLRIWRKDPNFQAALRQFAEPEAKSELFQLYKTDLINRYRTNTVGKDVRESVERFLGIGNNGTQINIGIAVRTPKGLSKYQ